MFSIEYSKYTDLVEKNDSHLLVFLPLKKKVKKVT